MMKKTFVTIGLVIYLLSVIITSANAFNSGEAITIISGIVNLITGIYIVYKISQKYIMASENIEIKDLK